MLTVPARVVASNRVVVGDTDEGVTGSPVVVEEELAPGDVGAVVGEVGMVLDRPAAEDEFEPQPETRKINPAVAAQILSLLGSTADLPHGKSAVGHRSHHRSPEVDELNSSVSTLGLVPGEMPYCQTASWEAHVVAAGP